MKDIPRTPLRRVGGRGLFAVAGTVVVAALSAGCGRPAGPNTDERGKLTYWLIISDSGTTTGCSDNPYLGDQNLLLTPPPLAGGAVWYFVYSVSSDGTTATNYSCPENDELDCTPTPLTWQISGHVLTATLTPDPVPFGSGDCQIQQQITATLVDKGGDMDAAQTSILNLEGPSDDCTTADDDLKNQSGNGLGAGGCTSSVSLHASFSMLR